MRRRWWVIVTVVGVLAAPLGVDRAVASHPPPNDDFAAAAIVDEFPFNDIVTTTHASTETFEPHPSCVDTIGRTVWYRVTLDDDADLRLDTSGSDFDTVIGVYTGKKLKNLSEVACNDDPDGGSLQARLTLTAAAGTTYHIQVGGFAGKSGRLELSIRRPPAVNTAKDNFADSVEIAPLPFEDETDTSGFTLESGEPRPSCAFDPGASAWYRFTPDQDTGVVAETKGSDYDTVVAVYRGSDLSDLVEVACNDDAFGSLQSRVVFGAEAGVTYHFQVTDWNGEGGGGALVFTASTAQFTRATADYVGYGTFFQSGMLLGDCDLDVNVGGVCFDLDGTERTVVINEAVDLVTGDLGAVVWGFRFGDEPIDSPMDASCVPSRPLHIPQDATQLVVWTFDPVLMNLFGVGACEKPPALATSGEITVSFFEVALSDGFFFDDFDG